MLRRSRARGASAEPAPRGGDGVTSLGLIDEAALRRSRPRLHPRKVGRPDIDRHRNWLAERIGPDGRACFMPATVARKLSGCAVLDAPELRR